MEQWNRRYSESSHRFDPEPKMKKKGRRSFLSSLCSIRGALGPCRPLTVRQPRLECLVWTGFLEFFSDGPPFRRSPPLPNFSRRDLSPPSNQSFYEFYSRERVKSHPFFFTSKDRKLFSFREEASSSRRIKRLGSEFLIIVALEYREYLERLAPRL